MAAHSRPAPRVGRRRTGTVAPVAFVAQAGDFVEGLCMLSGRGAYSPEQVTVEPEFGRDTEADRRGVVVAEAPYIRAFEYGDVPGYARISIGEAVRTHLHAGLAAESWRTLDLSALRDRAAPARGASGRRPLHLEHSERSWRLA